MTDLSVLSITDAKKKQFFKKNIYSGEDLLRFFPRSYVDYSTHTVLNPIADGEAIQGAFIITVIQATESPYGAKVPYVKIFGKDRTSGVAVTIFWFRQRLQYGTFRNVASGVDFFVAGKAVYAESYQSFTISMPSVFVPYNDSCFRILPVYSKIEGMSDSYLSDSIASALRNVNLTEPYPVSVAHQNGYPSYSKAIQTLHMPESDSALELAQKRIIFDVLLDFCLRLQYAERNSCSVSPYIMTADAVLLVEQAKKLLPFDLTIDQISILDALFAKLSSGKRVNALVQGDVGSGKTAVAFLLMVAMVKSGYQCAIMAPSKVLAQQHYENISKLSAALGIQTAFYIGGTALNAKEKKSTLAAIASGQAGIVIGTHSLLSKSVSFKNLAMVITDEEHKFGVAQKASLIDRYASGVHSISMSATPIPRSLAQVVYGDQVDLHTITTLPAGRKPVQTAITSKISTVLPSVERRLVEGHQVFVVCPMISHSENRDGVKSVDEILEIYSNYFVPKGYRIASLTGKTSKKDMEETLRDFQSGVINILVATTVIEVGINVPNANMIVIHNAECFGLSSLHQLRGRVGRAAYQSYCVLVSSAKDNPRLQIMTTCNDGFAIAKADLQIRGAGDWLGEEQSGATRQVQYMLACPDIYQQARSVAADALQSQVTWEIVQNALSNNINESEE